MAIFGKLGRYQNFGLLVMRIGLGAMMILHGKDKLIGGPETWAGLGLAMGKLHIHFWPAFWGFMCAITETIGGLFCMLGLWFRLVCLLLVINFIVAALANYTNIYKIDDIAHAVELASAFFGLMFIGAGAYSVDKS
jgi:putative oxidoreductase